jgi:hypothetical protein
MIYLRAKVCLPRSNGSLVIAFKLKEEKKNFITAPVLCFAILKNLV